MGKETWKYCVREVRTCGDLAFVPLPNGEEAIIDANMAEAASVWNWHIGRTDSGFTIRRSLNPGYQTLADLISPPPAGMQNDHRNRNPLDNRRLNLRHCTNQQNSQNRMRSNVTGYKGVGRHGRGWRARITTTAKRVSLGCFDTPEAAARAYDKAAVEHFGEFACLNFDDVA